MQLSASFTPWRPVAGTAKRVPITRPNAIIPSVNISRATSLNISLREVCRGSVCADESVDDPVVWDSVEQVEIGVIETMVTGSEDGKVVAVKMVVERTVDDAAMDMTVDRDDVTGTVEKMVDVDETGGAVQAMQEVEQEVEQR